MSAVLRHVLLLQRDVPAAAKFYREGLGLVVNVCTERWAELGDARPTSDASTSPPTVIALKAVDSEAQRSTGYSPCSTSRSATSTPPSTTSFARVLCWTARSDTHPGVRWRPCALRTDTCSASSNPPKASETRWRRSATTPRQRGCLRTRPQAHGGERLPSPRMSSRRRASGRDDRRHRDDVSPDAALRPPPGRRRVVLHCDADAFFCQVERSRDPSLARVPALAVFQHGDVISVDAGARAAGVTRDDAPSAAREKIRAVGGVLAHVHVVEGHRVSYRPYLAASAALMRLLASEDVARAVARATRDAMRVDAEVTGSNPGRVAIDDDRVAIDDDRDPSGRRFKVPALVVEKASIDEAYVQLPAGASLSRDARLAARLRRSFDLVSGSSCPSAPRRINSSRSARARRVNRTVSRSSRRTRTSPPCWRRRPRGRYRVRRAGVAARMQTALGAKTASDVAKKTPAALVAALGLAPAVAERAVLAARGVCDAPVVSRGAANGTVGVHTSLTAAPRRMPTRPGFEPVTSASGGRAGTFEPVRVWERDRSTGWWTPWREI